MLGYPQSSYDLLSIARLGFHNKNVISKCVQVCPFCCTPNDRCKATPACARSLIDHKRKSVPRTDAVNSPRETKPIEKKHKQPEHTIISAKKIAADHLSRSLELEAVSDNGSFITADQFTEIEPTPPSD